MSTIIRIRLVSRGSLVRVGEDAWGIAPPVDSDLDLAPSTRLIFAPRDLPLLTPNRVVFAFLFLHLQDCRRLLRQRRRRLTPARLRFLLSSMRSRPVRTTLPRKHQHHPLPRIRLRFSAKTRTRLAPSAGTGDTRARSRSTALSGFRRMSRTETATTTEANSGTRWESE